MQRGVLSPKLFNEFLQDLRKYLNPKYGLKHRLQRMVVSRLKIEDLKLAFLLFADGIDLFSEFVENLQAQS